MNNDSNQVYDPYAVSFSELKKFREFYEHIKKGLCREEALTQSHWTEVGLQCLENKLRPRSLGSEWMLAKVSGTKGESMTTPEGDALFVNAEKLIYEYDSTMFGSALGGRQVRIRAVRAVIDSLIANAMVRFHRDFGEFKEVKVVVEQAFDEDIREAVLSHHAHIGVGYRDWDLPGGTEGKILFRTRVMVMLRRTNPLARQAEGVSLSKLLEENLILLPHNSVLRQKLSIPRRPPKGRRHIVLPNVSCFGPYVERDLGIGFCFEHLTPPLPPNVTLRPVLFGTGEVTYHDVRAYMRMGWNDVENKDKRYPDPAIHFVQCLIKEGAVFGAPK